MVGVIGVIASLVLLMLIVYKGVGVIPASILCALVVIVYHRWRHLRTAWYSYSFLEPSGL